MDRLNELLTGLNAIAEKYNYPVIVSTHPRTRSRLDRLGMPLHPLIQDSKPSAITPRDAIERPEGIDVGCIIVTGVNSETVLWCIDAAKDAFDERVSNQIIHPVPVDYCIENTSERVVNLILGTAELSNSWDGIR